ncbi:MAG: Exosome complex component rrp4, partial [Paramarteilia canceri]
MTGNSDVVLPGEPIIESERHNQLMPGHGIYTDQTGILRTSLAGHIQYLNKLALVEPMVKRKYE